MEREFRRFKLASGRSNAVLEQMSRRMLPGLVLFVSLAGSVMAGTALTFEPSELDFGPVPVGTSSGPQFFTITNTSDTNIYDVGGRGPFQSTAYSFVSITPVGPTLQDQFGQPILLPGGGLVIGIAFTPSQPGPTNDGIYFTYYDPRIPGYDNTGTVNLYGAGAEGGDGGGELSIQCPGDIAVDTDPGAGGAIVRFADPTVTNNVGAVTITCDPASGSLFPIGTTQVNCTATDGGSNSASCSFDITVRETQPRLFMSLSRSSLSFDKQPLGTTSAAETITLTNTGDTALTTGSISVIGDHAGDFTVTGDCDSKTIGPGDTCDLRVTFTPTLQGSRHATLTVPSNAEGNPHTATLSGTGTVPILGLRPDNLEFHRQEVGTSSDAQTVEITNSGDAPLEISDVRIAGDHADDFRIVSDTGGETIDPALPGTIERRIGISFAPTTRGSRSARLEITSNAEGRTHIIPLSGFATAAVLTVDRESLDFGNQQVGVTSFPEPIILLKNTGDAPLTLRGMSLTGANPNDFKVNSVCGTIAPNESCFFSVSFTPSAPTSRSATLEISSNSLNGTQSIRLSGTGFFLTGIPVPLTPQQEILNVITRVTSLMSAGILDLGEGQSLTAKLEAAVKQLDQGKATPAVNQLQAFIKHVEGLVRKGRLSSTQGQALIDAAQAIINRLGGQGG